LFYFYRDDGEAEEEKSVKLQKWRIGGQAQNGYQTRNSGD